MADMSLVCKSVILQDLRTHEPLFGKWRIAGYIGAGASGCVFKIERRDLGQSFVAALKVIPLTRETEDDPEKSKTLEESIGKDSKEILHLYTLSGHTNVVSWHNHEILIKEDDDVTAAYILVMMDYLPDSLSRLLKQGPLPVLTALHILIDCLHGLEHIHRHDTIHRDLKPGNIFITEAGTAKIGDFGIARRVSESMRAKTVTGTPLYMAPEVYRDPLGAGYDFSADIYSLALVGYEMIEGHLPFAHKGVSGRDMIQRRFSGEKPDFSRAIPAALKDALHRGLAFDATERFQTAREFRLALSAIRDAMQDEQTAPPAPGKVPAPPSESPGQSLDDQTVILRQARPDDTMILRREPGQTPAQADPDMERTMVMPGLDQTRVMSETDQNLGLSGLAGLNNLPEAETRPMRATPEDLDLDAAMRADGQDLSGITTIDESDPWVWEEEPERPASLEAEADNDEADAAQPSGFSQEPPPVGVSQTGNTRLVRILQCDKAQAYVFFSRKVCERFVALGREIIREKGHLPLELGNRQSLHVDESLLCGRVLSLGLIEDLLMGEVEILEAHRYTLESILDTESYLIMPKYYGIHLNRGENQYVRSVNLQLIGFTVEEKE